MFQEDAILLLKIQTRIDTALRSIHQKFVAPNRSQEPRLDHRWYFAPSNGQMLIRFSVTLTISGEQGCIWMITLFVLEAGWRVESEVSVMFDVKTEEHDGCPMFEEQKPSLSS